MVDLRAELIEIQDRLVEKGKIIGTIQGRLAKGDH